ncbi:hypothetical protein [Rhizobium herbae]|uniref:Exo-alpha-sialidase n=1 Tax=Rhizobium herbae TaxID=508661 RepID=A0ABS4EGQ1_9HYPH|nr:hypothetical protein [Rhizobium herbae]MBP1857031.1 hypothetical protein [Rhizobium herbae]
MKVRTGKEGEAPPLYVSHISRNLIFLGGGPESERREITFSNDGKRWENADLLEKLISLNTQALPFKFNQRDIESPDMLMSWWQETGKLTVSFDMISWHGPGQWIITTIEPPIIGMRGWTGPAPFGQ